MFVIIERSFGVTCVGTFVDDGDYLEFVCTATPGGQSIATVEYYINEIFQGQGL